MLRLPDLSTGLARADQNMGFLHPRLERRICRPSWRHERPYTPHDPRSGLRRASARPPDRPSVVKFPELTPCCFATHRSNESHDDTTKGGLESTSPKRDFAQDVLIQATHRVSTIAPSCHGNAPTAARRHLRHTERGGNTCAPLMLPYGPPACVLAATRVLISRE